MVRNLNTKKISEVETVNKKTIKDLMNERLGRQFDGGLYLTPKYEGVTSNEIYWTEEYLHYLRMNDTNISFEEWHRKENLEVYTDEEIKKYFTDDFIKFCKERYTYKDEWLPWPRIAEEGCEFLKDYVIFDWFMANCKEAKLYCRYFNVTKEELESLLSRCRFALNNPSVAKKLFPLGEYWYLYDEEIEEYYEDRFMRGLLRTEKCLTNLLEKYDLDKINVDFDYSIAYLD